MLPFSAPRGFGGKICERVHLLERLSFKVVIAAAWITSFFFQDKLFPLYMGPALYHYHALLIPQGNCAFVTQTPWAIKQHSTAPLKVLPNWKLESSRCLTSVIVEVPWLVFSFWHRPITQLRHYPTGPFTILAPHNQEIGRTLCSSATSGDRYWSSKIAKGSVRCLAAFACFSLLSL